MAILPEPIEPSGRPVAPARASRPARRRAIVAPAPSGEAALAARAAEVLRASERPPERWLLPGFARDVDLVRRQLSPLHERRMLVASYERESARLAALRRLAADPAAPPAPIDALEAGYVIRWLELGSPGGTLPAWLEWLRKRSASGTVAAMAAAGPPA
jgi:hypothetical protein